NGAVRPLDVGLLFDPARPGEVDFCQRWRALLEADPWSPRVRDNQPYLGADDGLTTSLRPCFDPESYIGVEIEVNQGIVDGPRWTSLKRAVVESGRRAVHETVGSVS
ncbi:MAG: N-formylglutamate amidohydrolase, partial [Planctomycetia bacterium]